MIQPNAGVAGDDKLGMQANSASIFTMQYVLSSLTVLLGGVWLSAFYARLFQWLSGVFERLWCPSPIDTASSETACRYCWLQIALLLELKSSVQNSVLPPSGVWRIHPQNFVLQIQSMQSKIYMTKRGQSAFQSTQSWNQSFCMAGSKNSLSRSLTKTMLCPSLVNSQVWSPWFILGSHTNWLWACSPAGC